MKTLSLRSRDLWSALNRVVWVGFLVLAGCGGQGGSPTGEGAKAGQPGAELPGPATAPAPAGPAATVKSSEAGAPADVILPDPDEERGKADGPTLPK